jgi:flagellar protein FliS
MHTPLSRAKQQYIEQQVISASPERLVTMLYDRLLVDIDRADAALERSERESASDSLIHAQDIIAELNGSLSDDWEGSADLRGLYTFLNGRLIVANVTRNRAVTLECRNIIAPLRDAWHQAAASLATVGAPVDAVV